MRLFGSLAFILLQMGRMAIVIFLPALALSAATGFNLYVAVLLMGIVTTLYTAVGGIEAVVWTDVVQVVVLLGGALLSLVMIVASIDGGLPGLISVAAAENKFHTFTWTWDYTTTAVWVVLIGNLFGNLIPYTADQAVVQRYLTTRDEASAARSIWTNALLTIPAGLIFFGVGTALFVFYRQHPGNLDPTLQTDAIFPLFIVRELPAGVSGLLIAGVFAAAMSTLSSGLNSVGSAIVSDFYARLVPGTTATTRLRLGRWLTVLFGAICTLAGIMLATVDITSLWDVFVEMLGLFGAGLAGLFALGIFTRRANGSGALIGAVASVLVLWVVKVATPVHFFLYAPIGIITCFMVGYLASLLTRARAPSLSLDGLTIYTLGAKHAGRPDTTATEDSTISATIR